jgi:hypothetical protein
VLVEVVAGLIFLVGQEPEEQVEQVVVAMVVQMETHQPQGMLIQAAVVVDKDLRVVALFKELHRQAALAL